MASEIAEESNAPARHCADLHVLRSPRLAAVDEGGLRDAPENSVELLLADMKCIVMHLKALPAIIEVERQRLVDPHGSERAHRAVIGESEYLCEELCRRHFVMRRYDRVIENDSHYAPPA